MSHFKVIYNKISNLLNDFKHLSVSNWVFYPILNKVSQNGFIFLCLISIFRQALKDELFSLIRLFPVCDISCGVYQRGAFIFENTKYVADLQA